MYLCLDQAFNPVMNMIITCLYIKTTNLSFIYIFAHRIVVISGTIPYPMALTLLSCVHCGAKNGQVMLNTQISTITNNNVLILETVCL